MSLALCMMTGSGLAQSDLRLPWVYCALLAAFAVALGGRAGSLVAVVAISLLAARMSGPAPPTLSGVEFGRVVSARVECSGPWRERHYGGITSLCRLLSLRQGSTMLPGRRVFVRVDLSRGVRSFRRARLRGRLEQSLPLPGAQSERRGRPEELRFRVQAAAFATVEAVPLERADLARARIERLLLSSASKPGPGQQLVAALWLGRPERLDPELAAGLRRWGLGHLFAVSGLHLGLLALGLFGLARALGWRRLDVVVVLAAAGFALLAGGKASVLRALFMLTVVVGSRWARRTVRSSDALALAVCVLLAGAPSRFSQDGFRLSVAATAGILWAVASQAEQSLRSDHWARALRVALLAWLATLPLMTSFSPFVCLISPVVNLLLVPWTAVLLFAGVVQAVTAFCAPGWVAVSGRVVEVVALPFTLLAECRPLPGLHLPLTTSGALAFVLSMMVLLIWARRWILSSVVWIILVAAAASQPIAGEPTIRFLDVGQGDATILEGGGAVFMIDGGPAWNPGYGGPLLSHLARLGIPKLDVLVLSHGDSDHCAGSLELSRYLPIAELWVAAPTAAPSSRCQSDLIRLFQGRVRFLTQSEVLTRNGWIFSVLADGRRERNSNSRSLVLRAEWHGASAVFTGDIDRDAELRILQRFAGQTNLEELRGDVLKVAHHGSASSSRQEFLQAVRPTWAVVSAGRDNPYGHPAEHVLRQLEQGRVMVWRTDRSGSLRMRWKAGAWVPWLEGWH